MEKTHIELNHDLQKLIRYGLLNMDNRSNALARINENKDKFGPKEFSIAEAALMDLNTIPDDLDDILEGKHYQLYFNANEKILNEEEDYKNYLDNNSEPKIDNAHKIPIIDTSNTNDNGFIDVSMEDVLEFAKKGNYFSGDKDEELAVSQKKIMKALNDLSTLAPIDQEDFKASINKAVDVDKQKKNNKITKKKFCNAVNTQMTYDERVQLIAMYLRNARDVWNSNNKNK